MPRRMIDTDMWADERFSELSVAAKMVFFRLVSGPEMGPAGAARIPMSRLSGDTGLSPDDAKSGLEDCVRVDLARRYEGGWIWLPAFIRYQLSGPQFIRGIRRQAAECPKALSQQITRSLDAIVGPGKDQIAENRSEKAVTRSEKVGTDKDATSREDLDSPATVTEESVDRPGSFREKCQDQDQDQDQDRPYGLSVLVQVDGEQNEPESSSGTQPRFAKEEPPIVAMVGRLAEMSQAKRID